MPEGVEVFILSNELNKQLKNYILVNLKILGGRYKRHGVPEGYNTIKKNLPLKIINVKCKGKFLYFTLEKKWYIMITLGLKGKIRVSQLKIKHDNIEFITNRKKFYFNDYRNFGTVLFTNDKSKIESKLKILGPDPLQDKFTLSEFKKILKSIKNQDLELLYMLNNQCIISGIGNYLRADILYYAKLNPFRTLRGLSNDNIKNLYKLINYVIKRSYKIQISKNNTKDKTLIYNKKIDKNNEKLDKIKDKDNRTIWFVPSIQR